MSRKDQRKDHWMHATLTMLLSIMVSALTLGLFTVNIPEASRDVVVFIAGQIVNAFLISVSFWLGSSRGSQEKTRQMAMTNNKEEDSQ